MRSKNVTGTWRELSNVFFSIFPAIMLLEVLAIVSEKVVFSKKFALWWPLVTSILTSPENDLSESLRALRSLSNVTNVICRLSKTTVVFFYIRWGFWSPPPRHKLNLLAPANNSVNLQRRWGMVVHLCNWRMDSGLRTNSLGSWLHSFADTLRMSGRSVIPVRSKAPNMPRDRTSLALAEDTHHQCTALHGISGRSTDGVFR